MRIADETLVDILQNLDDAQIVDVWNEYCDAIDYTDDRIYGMYELDEMFYGQTAHELLDALSDDFSGRDDWMRYTIYGLESFSNPFDKIDIEDLAVWIADEERDFGIEVLEEYFENKEEDEEGGDEE